MTRPVCNRPSLVWLTAIATRRAELIAHLRPNSEAAECYRSLRTSILLSALDSPPKVLLVTSPLPQEGKTTTSVNCAIVLAQRGSRVLLVDADLRRPGVHRAFGFDRKGWTEYCAGRHDHDGIGLQVLSRSCRTCISCRPVRRLPTQPNCSTQAR